MDQTYGMKQVYGVWLPVLDTHFQRYMNEDGSYQRDTFRAAMEHVKEPKIFYDIGAHVGLWSLMAQKAGFKRIYAYEPNENTFVCLQKNVTATNECEVSLNNFGINDHEGHFSIIQASEGNSGAINFQPLIDFSMCGYRFNRADIIIPGVAVLPHQCLVKIDTEGMEARCVMGMQGIIHTIRPVVCVEQRTNNDALDILQQMGMQIVNQVRKDYILTWKNL